MSKPVLHNAVTANRLSDGKVLYVAVGAPGRPRWCEDFADAEVTPDPGHRDALFAWAKAQQHDACGMYVIDVAIGADGVRRMSQRERLRAAGREEVLTRLKLEPGQLAERTAAARLNPTGGR